MALISRPSSVPLIRRRASFSCTVSSTTFSSSSRRSSVNSHSDSDLSLSPCTLLASVNDSTERLLERIAWLDLGSVWPSFRHRSIKSVPKRHLALGATVNRSRLSTTPLDRGTSSESLKRRLVDDEVTAELSPVEKIGQTSAWWQMTSQEPLPCRQSIRPNVYIRPLPKHFTDDDLYRVCLPKNGDGTHLKCWRVMTEQEGPSTGLCKGFGFCLYTSVNAAVDGIEQLKRRGYQASFARTTKSDLAALQDPSNANVYLAGLPTAPHFDEVKLRSFIPPHLNAQTVKLVVEGTEDGRGIAFVRFYRPSDAAYFIKHMHGMRMEGSHFPVMAKLADSPQQKAYKRSAQWLGTLKQTYHSGSAACLREGSQRPPVAGADKCHQAVESPLSHDGSIPIPDIYPCALSLESPGGQIEEASSVIYPQAHSHPPLQYCSPPSATGVTDMNSNHMMTSAMPQFFGNGSFVQNPGINQTLADPMLPPTYGANGGLSERARSMQNPVGGTHSYIPFPTSPHPSQSIDMAPAHPYGYRWSPAAYPGHPAMFVANHIALQPFASSVSMAANPCGIVPQHVQWPHSAYQHLPQYPAVDSDGQVVPTSLMGRPSSDIDSQPSV